MAVGDIGSAGRGFGELLRDLASSSADLLRAEVKLARMEIADIVTRIGKGTAFVAIGAVLLLLGALALLAGIVLLAGDQWLPRDQYWLAALIVVLVTGGLTFWFVKRGRSALSSEKLAPDQTVATLKEDKEWLKQRLTSGATSS